MGSRRSDAQEALGSDGPSPASKSFEAPRWVSSRPPRLGTEAEGTLNRRMSRPRELKVGVVLTIEGVDHAFNNAAYHGLARAAHSCRS